MRRCMTRNGFIKKIMAVTFGVAAFVAPAMAEKVISKGEAAEIAQKHYGGQAFKIKKITGSDDKPIFEVKLELEKMRIKIVYVDMQGKVRDRK